MTSSNPPPFRARIMSVFEPAQLLLSAAYQFLVVVLETILIRRQPADLFNPDKLRKESFSRWWLQFASGGPPPPVEELQGSAALIPPLLSLAKGDVLDIGPGSGVQTRYFPIKSPALKRIHAAEPAVGLHKELRASADAAGLGDRYVILGCTADEAALVPALTRAGLLENPKQSMKQGLFDTVVCIRVLCGVPEPEETIQSLYRLLRPGGSLLVCEHVINPWTTPKGSPLARLMQIVYHALGWSFFIGDCAMNRDIESMLRQTAARDGGWADVQLDRSFQWSALPYISGRLEKKT